MFQNKVIVINAPQAASDDLDSARQGKPGTVEVPDYAGPASGEGL